MERYDTTQASAYLNSGTSINLHTSDMLNKGIEFET